MKWILSLSTCCVIILSVACTRSQPDKEAEKKQAAQPPVEIHTKNQLVQQPELLVAKPLFSKEIKENLHFASSLERESLRLISHNPSLDPTTLFSVLSYAFEVASGTKKTPPRNIDCGRFQIEKSEQKMLKVFKICEKPFKLVATLQPRLEETAFEVTFKIKEWASVVGLSVTLTNSDIVCQLQIKDKKLNALSCEHWAYFLSASDASATEIHLKTMSFHRDQSPQLKLSGGFFRDLVERKKIDIHVPIEGKIKLIEKEIEVKDDFANQVKTSEDIRGEKENSKKSNEKSNKEKEDYQKWIKEGETSDQNHSEGQEQNSAQSQSGEPIHPNENPGALEGRPPSEVIEGETSGGVPQEQQPKNRGR